MSLSQSLSLSNPPPLSSQSVTPITQYVACAVDDKSLTLLGRVPQDTIAELKALANIIRSSIEQIEQVTTANCFTFPSPDSTFSPETEAPLMHPAIQSAGSLIVSAAGQLITLVRPAPLTLLDISSQVSLEGFQSSPPP